jgi:hypothetical protein
VLTVASRTSTHCHRKEKGKRQNPSDFHIKRQTNHSQALRPTFPFLDDLRILKVLPLCNVLHLSDIQLLFNPSFLGTSSLQMQAIDRVR